MSSNLQSDLEISTEAISLVKKTKNLDTYTLPMILRQYVLLDKKQLDRVFDWLEIA